MQPKAPLLSYNLYLFFSKVNDYHLFNTKTLLSIFLFMLQSFLFQVTIQPPSPYIRKTARQVVLSRCYAANFAHIWGGGSIRATLRIR